MNPPETPFLLRRRQILQWSSAGAGLVLLPALAQAQGQATATPRRGGTLTALVHPEPPVLTTIAHTALFSAQVSAKVTEGLLDYDFDLNPVPQLATAWSVSPDGLQYTFKLRQGVKWHDGKPFTSADVAYSLRTLKEVHPRGRATFASLADIQTPDAHTVVLKLGKPVPYLLTALSAAESPIVPRHLYEGTQADTNPYNNKPVGTGPYVFKEWVRGSHIVYERNPHYWDAPRPYLDRLIIRFIPDAAARTAALETGEVQLAPGNPVALGDLERLRKQGRLQFTSEGYQYINSVFRLEFNLERPLFKDLRVRRAFAHAINRPVLLSTAWYGQGQLTPGPISPTLKRFFVANLDVPGFDLARANQLLDEAGFARGADGVRLRTTLDPMPNEGSIRSSDYLKQALAKIGVEVTLRSQDFSSYVKRIYTDRDFDFHVGGMSNTFDPTVGIQRLYWSKSFKRGLPFSNGSGYANADVDRLLEAAAVEINPARRVQQFTEVQKLLLRDLPDLTLVAPDSYTIASPRVRDHTVTGTGFLGNLAHVYLTA